MVWLTRILLLTLLMGATTGFADTGNPAEPQLKIVSHLFINMRVTMC
ncbi:hypothetical protein [Aliidiomarina sedimenti]|nr:hypothetical protein [Aliidiomarina sedimenti]